MMNEKNMGATEKNNKENLTVLENILNGMDAYIYVTDPETDEILFINDKMREHFDFGSHDGTGVKCYQVLQDGMAERCAFCPIRRLNDYPKETIAWEEHNTVTKRYYRNSDKFIEWSDGRLVHMQHSIDITEMKEAAAILDHQLAQQELMSKISQGFVVNHDIEDAISQSLKMLGEFAKYSAVRLFFYNKQEGSLYVSHEWRADGGLNKSSALSIPFHEGDPFYERTVSLVEPTVVYKDGPTAAASVLTAPISLKGQFLGLVEFEVDKSNHPFENNDVNLVKFFCGVAAGVYDRMQTDVRFTKMSILIERIAQPVVYIDTDEKVTYYNATTYKGFGYTEEEWLKGGIEMLFGKKTYERVRTEIWPKAFKEGFIEVELPIFRKDGSVRIFSFIGVVVDVSGEPLQIATIGADITDLVSAKEAAETASKAKGEFLARMSHEIRTPMNAIIGMTNIARESNDLERKKYCLDKISNASKHLLGVINDILDMSKIEANKFDISMAEFDFEKMLMNITNMIGFRMDEKAHHFLINFDPDMPQCVIGDEQRLSQVIVNLLSNAVKFTPENGSISLVVHSTNLSDTDIRLNFTVSDTGIGITPDQQSKLFNSFEQADGSISRKFGGTGLGLAISKRIVELMGGEISIESTPGFGTNVSFDVVVKKGAPKQQVAISCKINRENLRLLLVDDSPATREYFQHLMTRLNIRHSVAASGESALEKIKTAEENGRPYNFFFVDWSMPGMDGIEFATILKSRMATDAIVIMISAAQWSDIEMEATAAGVDGFIPKPLFPSALVDCINTRLGAVNDANRLAGADEKIMDFANFNLLLVEDIDVNREIVIALLEDTNINIDIAENGAEAVEKFRAHEDKYDLIFMDVHMPVMDGYEATRMIRAGDSVAAKQIPIIAMTANAFREDVDRCKNAGMNDHVSKPIDRTVVLEKMYSWLHPRKKKR